LVRAAQHAGISQYRYHTDPLALASAQVIHTRDYDYDGVFISSDNVVLYSALGGKIVFPDEDSYPHWTNPLLSGVEDLATLSVPDPQLSDRMSLVQAASAEAVRQAGDELFLLTNIDSGPFQLAGTLMGMEQALVSLSEHPDDFDEILAFCTEVALAYGTAMAATGCHGLQFGESTASLVGRERYQELIWPHDCHLVRGLQDVGARVFLHVCGDSSPLLDLMADTGADCLEIDSVVNLCAAKQLVGDHTVLKGNIPTTSFLSSPQVFEQECQTAVAAGKPGGRYILCAGCEVPAAASDKNMHLLRQAADRWGRYAN
jgi:MtaA/CmuA family methyltransferase